MSLSTPSRRQPTVIVIGGGPAGLSASAELVSQGVRVILIEAQRTLGGRAASHLHRASGEILNLGPHTVIEANRNFLNHLAKVGTRDQIEFPSSLRIRFIDSAKGIADLQCPPLPSPWGFLWGILTFRFLSIADRFRTIRLGRFLASIPPDQLPDITISHWFDINKVSVTARQFFWDPLTVAALNNQPERLALRALAAIIHYGFLAPGQRTGLGVPRVDWSRLLEGDLREQIASVGGEVITGKRVELIKIEGGRANAAILAGNHRIEGDAVISAIPPHGLLRLLPSEPSWLTPALRFEWSPIVSFQWIVSNPLPIKMPVAALGEPVQWMFTRSLSTDDGRATISTITGGDHALMSMDRSTLIAEIVSCIRRLFPAWSAGDGDQKVLHRIRKATISISAGQNQDRPGPGTDIPGFWIAGDWTDTSLPPTLESAVLSGINSAKLAASYLKIHC
jgi:squalene-associated FAD-dependent desaturase